MATDGVHSKQEDGVDYNCRVGTRSVVCTTKLTKSIERLDMFPEALYAVF